MVHLPDHAAALDHKISVVLDPDPRKIEKGESGKSARVEVYTAPSMQVDFQLDFD